MGQEGKTAAVDFVRAFLSLTRNRKLSLNRNQKLNLTRKSFHLMVVTHWNCLERCWPWPVASLKKMEIYTVNTQKDTIHIKLNLVGIQVETSRKHII